MTVFPAGIPIESEKRATDIGTLTCYAVPRAAPGTQVLLTADHVIGRTDKNLAMGTPSLGSCPSCCVKNVFAHAFVNGMQGNVGPPGKQAYVDCAMASLEPGVQGFNRIVGLEGRKRGTGEFLGAFLAGVGIGVKGEKVTVATKSGLIPGVIKELTAGSPTSPFKTAYKSNMLIETDPKYWTSAQEGSGDSGAAVVNEFNEVVGLMHARGALTPVDMDVLPLIVACHMKMVIDHLQVDIKPDWESFPAAGSVLHQIPVDEADFARVQPGIQGEILQRYERRLRSTSLGRSMLDAGLMHGAEIGRLVHHCRPVLVAWHRSQGPAWAAHLLNRARDDSYQLPREVQGVSRRDLLIQMREVLSRHGSAMLREQLNRFYDPVLALSEASDADELFALLGAMQPT